MTDRYFYIVEAASGPYAPSQTFDDLQEAVRHATDVVRNRLIPHSIDHPSAPTWIVFYSIDGKQNIRWARSIYGDAVEAWREEIKRAAVEKP